MIPTTRAVRFESRSTGAYAAGQAATPGGPLRGENGRVAKNSAVDTLRSMPLRGEDSPVPTLRVESRFACKGLASWAMAQAASW